MSETLYTILTIAYGASGFISLAAYWPQIVAFRNNPQACKSSPLSMWVLWTSQSIVVLLYAIVVNGDPLLILAGAASTVVNGGALGFMMWGRYKSSCAKTPA